MSARILIGTVEVARTTYNLQMGFRELGFEVDTLLYSPSKYYTDAEYTMRGVDFLAETSYRRRPDGTVAVRTSRSFLKFVENYDIFIFTAGASLLPRMVDLPILRQMGKTVIAWHLGTEVRDFELAKLFWGAYGRRYPFYENDVNTPPLACGHEADLLEVGRYHPALANKLHNVRTSERFADMVCSGPPSHTLSVRPYFQVGPAVDIGQFSFRVPRSRCPVILHAPSSPLYKQTDTILRGLEELANEGLQFRLELLTGVPHHQVREKLAEADILIDELSCGSGSLAYEGMASGCAVLGGHDGVSSPLPRNRPVLNITEDNFKEMVRRVVLDLPFRIRLAVQGREYMSQGIGSPADVARIALEHLERSRRGGADLYPTLFTDHAVIPPGHGVPPYLQRRTLEVLQAHGAHPDTDLDRLVREGLLPPMEADELAAIPRWEVSDLEQAGPWILLGPGATYGSPEPVASPDGPLPGSQGSPQTVSQTGPQSGPQSEQLN